MNPSIGFLKRKTCLAKDMVLVVDVPLLVGTDAFTGFVGDSFLLARAPRTSSKLCVSLLSVSKMRPGSGLR